MKRIAEKIYRASLSRLNFENVLGLTVFAFPPRGCTKYESVFGDIQARREKVEAFPFRTGLSGPLYDFSLQTYSDSNTENLSIQN